MLSKNWITDHNLDSEHKRYVLLGYLKKVSEQFDQSLLYPHLAELSKHYSFLKEFLELKDGLKDNFPKSMNGLDWVKMEAQYEEHIKDSTMMNAVQEIIDYAIPLMYDCLQDGQTIYDFYKDQIEIEAIGIAPLYDNEGYLLLLNAGANCTIAYRYSVSIYDNPEASYKKVNTVYLESYKSNISNTGESIKRRLVRDYTELPNPATYSIKTELSIPLQETLLPLAKRVLAEHLTHKPGLSN
ncbi:MAG: hypothetical protein JKX73_03795 [Flavobacteriales bacterium]|nr:hypothetical protein [Flavobacteriales bacterium]